MAPSILFDTAGIDMNQVVFDTAEIEKTNPHRGAMRLLDGVIYVEDDYSKIIAYKDIRDDEFWVPGHIPGRPIYPGVLMIESGAQLASFIMIRLFGGQFVGFVGVDKVKFRSQVVPGDRLIIMGVPISQRKRRCVCAVQGWVNDTLAFEAEITGMPI